MVIDQLVHSGKVLEQLEWKSIGAKSCRDHSIILLPKATVPCNVLKKYLQLKRISPKATFLPIVIMWENFTVTAQTIQRCEEIKALLQVTSSVCPSLLTMTLNSPRNRVWMVHSVLVLGLFPNINCMDFIKKKKHSRKINFHDNVLQQLNSYFEPFLMLVLKIKKCL